MGNDEIGKTTINGPDSGGLVGIARSVEQPGVGEQPAKRGRGRPVGSATKLPGANPPMLSQEPIIIWNPANTGALVRLPFATSAWITDIKELELSESEQAVIIPAAVDVLNQFMPLTAKWGAVIALSAGLISVSAAKYKLYRDVSRERAKAEKDKKEKPLT